MTQLHKSLSLQSRLASHYDYRIKELFSTGLEQERYVYIQPTLTSLLFRY